MRRPPATASISTGAPSRAPLAVELSAPELYGVGDRATVALAGSAPRARFEVLLVLTVVAVYLLAPSSEVVSGARLGAAVSHADGLVALQDRVGLLVEPELQRWALGWPALVVVANVVYGTLHFLVTPAVLAWLFMRRRPQYALWRNTLAFASLIAFAVYRLWPLAPPRLAGGAGGAPLLEDTLATHPTLWSFDSTLIEAAADPLAAMPSMHAGWAFACAWAVASTLGRPLARLVWLYPALITVVIVTTGNHYVLDAVGGVVVVLAAHLLARLVRRAARPAERRVAGTGVTVGP